MRMLLLICNMLMTPSFSVIVIPVRWLVLSGFCVALKYGLAWRSIFTGVWWFSLAIKTSPLRLPAASVGERSLLYLSDTSKIPLSNSIVLLSAILSATPLYYISFFILSYWVQEKIVSNRSRFLWGWLGQSKRKYHTVSWRQVLNHKRYED